ncbi:MAG: hypothetical protein AABO58_00875 [Acidobacteriota bacterium]
MLRKSSALLLAISMIATPPVYGQAGRKHDRVAAPSDDQAQSKRRALSSEDVDAFLWVEQQLFEKFAKHGSDVLVAKARTEIATARAFQIEPSNGAKRDMGIFVETNNKWEAERSDVEKRLAAASRRRSEEENNLRTRHGNKSDPGKVANLYWFKTARDYQPDDIYYPLAVARDAERKVEREREALYKKYHKETPEERLGGAIAILLVMGMLARAGGSVGRGAAARAALGKLGRAEAALAVTETKAASTAIRSARSILIASEDSAAALASVERARIALNAGKFDRAAAAVADARAALSTQLHVNPALALALAGADKSLASLAATEAEDAAIGVKERARIERFEYAASHDEEVRRLLAADLKLALEYVGRYRAMVAKGTQPPSAVGTSRH